MAKDKCPPCPPMGAPEWMVTYGDLMTLLLCFFVLLFSFSEMDKIQFESMKDSFTGAFGVMDGHSVRDGRGVSQQPQRYSTVLFDKSVEKVRKASSDKFPREKMEFLNSMIASAEQSVGILLSEAQKQGIAVDNLTFALETIKEKHKEDDSRKSPRSHRKESSEQFDAVQIEPRAEISQSTKTVRMTQESVSEVEGKAKLNKDKRQKNLEDKSPDEIKLARGDQFLQKRGDSSRSQKMQGRNFPMIGNPGENQLQLGQTGQNLMHKERMDRIEGKKDKKRFEHPTPNKRQANVDSPNVAGLVENTQSDANRAIIVLPEKIQLHRIFYEKTDKFLPGAENQLQKFVKAFRENYGGYFQVEVHTDEGPPPPQYDSNMDLTMRVAINFILKILDMGPDLSPSRFAAVGRGSMDLLKKGRDPAFRRLNNRIEIRWVKKGRE